MAIYQVNAFPYWYARIRLTNVKTNIVCSPGAYIKPPSSLHLSDPIGDCQELAGTGGGYQCRQDAIKPIESSYSDSGFTLFKFKGLEPVANG